jgi:hypothetical protein
MRTAVVRLKVDPESVLTPEQLRDGMATLLELAAAAGAGVVENDLASMPANRREVELLVAADDGDTAREIAIGLCAKSFSADLVPGVITFVSHGTDDDAQGVLSAFGLAGDIVRTPGDGFDIVHVTLREADLERIPESRVHTALEASLNCEVHIHTV